MKNVLKILFISSLLNPILVSGQGNVTNRPFQITFFPPIGTNGLNALHTVNHVSLNIFAGVATGLDGAEFGGFINMESAFVKGAQFAGFGNINAGEINAVQFAGFFNINKESGEAIQGAGFTNLNAGDMGGIEMAGFFNTSRNMEGFQTAGFGNYASDVEGGQLSGFVNVSQDMYGVQGAGFANIAGDVEGAQVSGFVNIARHVTGIQIAGFVNICDSIDGIPIAFLSIVRKNGYRKIEVWGDETFHINTSFKIGMEKFYTVYTLGIRPAIGSSYYTYGYGAGTNFTMDARKSLTLEYQFQQVMDIHYNEYAYDHSLHRFKVCFAYQISEKVRLFAGPTINLLSSKYPDYTNDIVPPWAFTIQDGKYRRADGWFGFNAGLRFL